MCRVNDTQLCVAICIFLMLCLSPWTTSRTISFSISNCFRYYYIMVSKIQWKPVWLATQLYPQSNWTGWQSGVTYAVSASAPFQAFITLREMFVVKGALSRYSVFLCRIFCGWKWRREDSRTRRWPMRSRPLPSFFFFTGLFRFSRSIDLGVSVSYPCKVTPLSDEVWLWDYDQESENKKTSLPWTMVKCSWHPKQACRAPRIDLELSWSDNRSRLAIFQVQLCIFRYTVQCTLR